MPSSRDEPRLRGDRVGAGTKTAALKGPGKAQARAATHAETFFYVKQVENRTPLVFRLRDGEEIRGVLDWYDQRAFRVALAEGGHLVLQKHAVAFVYKDPDAFGDAPES